MKKYLSLISALLLATNTAYGGLISHQDYVDGDVITAAKQNTNENAVFNEFNGNIESANVKDGTLVNADLSATAAVGVDKFSTIVQSTFTYVNRIGAYRRPVLQFINTTTVDVENNTGTSNETCIAFPDEIRCVTENTGSTSVNRRFVITEVAANSGTKNSGLYGSAVATNTWYALYGWKVSDNTTDFVIVGSTRAPTQANFSTLNSMFGTNQWVYLGMIRNGADTASVTNVILSFVQMGACTKFTNTIGSGDSINSLISRGEKLAGTVGVAGLKWTVSQGTGSFQSPATATMNEYLVALGTTTASSSFVRDSANGTSYLWIAGVSNTATQWPLQMPASAGLTLDNSSNQVTKHEIFLIGWWDNVLGVGFNPQL